MRFELGQLSEDEVALQEDVRAFLSAELRRGSFVPGLGMTAPYDPAFSRKLAARGWIGMALPSEYGGGGRTAVERFIVVEELLRWGAPVGTHWVADRQTGPMIARFGTEWQKQYFLPAICRSEVSFAIGMSEPDAGSDLASIGARATRTEGGWHLSGTKSWSGGANVSDWLVTLCRTDDRKHGHGGLTELLVDLSSPGVSVRPISFLDGTPLFCEVRLERVFVPDELVLGPIGAGWAVAMSELTFERAGPERWLSTYLLVEELLRERHADHERYLVAVGEALATWAAIRALSLSVVRMIDAGQTPVAEAALVKDLGTRFEQTVLDAIWQLVDTDPNPESASALDRLLARAILIAPAFTIRGGTGEILRSLAAGALQ
jgi:3-oxocholest-4-en-26-oyl-CoA dehydrogenase alpha subunit